MFGYEELREKVLCIEHDLDDRVLEALKEVVLTGAPGASAAGVTGLLLDAVTPDGDLELLPLSGESVLSEDKHVRVDGAMYARLGADKGIIASMKPSLFVGAYVNQATLSGVGR